MGTSIRSTDEGSRCKLALVDGDEEVARLTVEDREMRLGASWVRMGGIASVRTSPRHRNKGYGRRLMEGAIDYMRDEGFLVSVLFGIPAFYHRVGYATVLLAKSVMRVRTEAAESLTAACRVRSARAGEEEALLAIYREEIATRSGTVKRTEAAFAPWYDEADEWFQEPRRILVAEEDGRPVAYALSEQGWLSHSEWRPQSNEIAVPPEGVATAGASLIRALAAEASERRAEWLELELPPDAPLLAVLRTIGFRQETVYSHNQGGMGRIVNLSELATVLTDAVRERAEVWDSDDRVGRIAFTCGTERAEIEIGAGRTLAINLPQQNLLQLLIGYRSIAELLLEFPACVVEEDVAAVDALFPGGYPYMWNLDHF